MFAVSASAEQRASLITGMPVTVVAPDGNKWHGRLGSFSASDDGRYTAQVDGDVCLDCSLIPVVGETALAASVQVVAPVSGPVVPVSALRTEPDGSRSIMFVDGRTTPVTVRASADGFVVVDGVASGDRVLLPGPMTP
ncbi:MAG: hypothetical protein ABIP03_10015 [Aquihabitans sp.]